MKNNLQVSIMKSYPFLTTFPENGEFELKTLLDLYYFTGYVPYRLEYDQGKRKYVLRGSVLRRVIHYARTIFQVIRLFVVFGGNRIAATSRIPGPIKPFIIGQLLGLHASGILFCLVVSSSQFLTGLVLAFNLIKSNDSGNRSNPNSNSILNQKHVQFFNPLLLRRQMTVYFHCSCGILLTVGSYTMSHFGRIGFYGALVTTWNSLISGTETDFSWWKGLLSLPFLLAEIDSCVLMSCGFVLLFVTGSTLKSLLVHLVKSLKHTRQYCVIRWEEILDHFSKLRLVFTLMGGSLGWLMFGITVIGGMFTCLGVMWAVFDGRGLLLFSLAVYGSYFAMFVIRSSQESTRLSYVSSLLTFEDGIPIRRLLHLSSGRRGSSLDRLITVYEINSESVGLKAKDIFTVTYGFIGSVVVAILSNTTIVMQSFPAIASYFVAINSGSTNA